jgi:hypothetical protein
VAADDGTPVAAVAADDTVEEVVVEICSNPPDRPALTRKPPSIKPRKARLMEQETFSWSILLMSGDNLRAVYSITTTITNFPCKNDSF